MLNQYKKQLINELSIKISNIGRNIIAGNKMEDIDYPCHKKTKQKMISVMNILLSSLINLKEALRQSEPQTLDEILDVYNEMHRLEGQYLRSIDRIEEMFTKEVEERED